MKTDLQQNWVPLSCTELSQTQLLIRNEPGARQPKAEILILEVQNIFYDMGSALHLEMKQFTAVFLFAISNILTEYLLTQFV